MGIHIFLKDDPNFGKVVQKVSKETSKLCMHGSAEAVANNYVKYEALKKAHGIIVSYTTRSMTNFNGYLLFKIYSNYLYVDVICSKGAGKALLKECYDLAKKMGKFQIKLSALPHVISFYRKQGFVHSESCTMDSNIQNKSNKILSKRFTNLNNVMKDKNFDDLLSTLVKKKLVAKKKCKTVDDCSKDGFSMTKCI